MKYRKLNKIFEAEICETTLSQGQKRRVDHLP